MRKRKNKLKAELKEVCWIHKNLDLDLLNLAKNTAESLSLS